MGRCNNTITIKCDMKKQDNIYKKPQKKISPFEFNKNVVDVFDDMIHRSVPLYKETILRLVQLSEKFYIDNSNIYDLGCSNGNFGITFLQEMGKKPFHMIAVDNSKHMLEAYRKRLEEKPNGDFIELILENILNVPLENASVVVINLTLQFLPRKERDNIIRNIFQALCPGGILLITEKVVHSDEEMTALQQEFYFRFKRENGYSNLEISQKRDALENVLIPETVEKHVERFEKAGFKHIDMWQKWFNFTAFICRK